jgi:hypothetical protein
MIRDPSDGSVREKPSKEINLPANETSDLAAESGSKGITSALPPLPKDAKQASRLNKSREWLANYHRKGISEHD